MMNNYRYQNELAVLQSKLPSNIYQFIDMNMLVMAARTNRGNIYTLKMDLSNFPENVPQVFVNKMLYDACGCALDSPSPSMHTLNSENGCTQICHYGRKSWNNMVSLYKVYLKCRIWLEIYEEHLRSGEPIDFYLTHQY